MAETADRVYKRKRIKISQSEVDYVDIPVIYEAHFKTLAEQAAERFLYFDNSSGSSRKIHVKRVYNIADVNAGRQGDYVDVERIDEIHVHLAEELAQEYAFFFENKDPPPIQPDGTNNPAHEAVHYVRYYKENDSSLSFVDCELIDQLKLKDTPSQAQEWVYFLRHPELGNTIEDDTVPYVVTKGYCDPSLELAPDESQNGIDPPFRLDPFQNIVNVQGKSWLVVGVEISGGYDGTACGTGSGTLPIPGNAFTHDYMTTYHTELNDFGGTAGTIAGQFINSGLSWSCSSQGNTQSVGPYEYLAATGQEGVSWGYRTKTPTAPPYADFDSFYDTLSVDLEVYGYSGDGPYFTGPGPGHSGTDVIQAFHVSDTEILIPSNVFTLGDLLQTRTLDFSGVTATYLGKSFIAVATRGAGQSVQILLKPVG